MEGICAEDDFVLAGDAANSKICEAGRGPAGACAAREAGPECQLCLPEA